MKHTLLLLVVCVGIISNLYADEMFVKHAGEYDILVASKLTYTGIFLDDYDIKAKVIKDGQQVNLCTGYMDCTVNKRIYATTCPRTEEDWTQALLNIDWVCVEDSPSINSILSDYR